MQVTWMKAGGMSRRILRRMKAVPPSGSRRRRVSTDIDGA